MKITKASSGERNAREIDTDLVPSGDESPHTQKFSPKKKSPSPSRKYSINKIEKPIKGLSKQGEANFHANKIYGKIGNYDHVVSPVAINIKETVINLFPLLKEFCIHQNIISRNTLSSFQMQSYYSANFS